MCMLLGESEEVVDSGPLRLDQNLQYVLLLAVLGVVGATVLILLVVAIVVSIIYTYI